MLSMTKAQGKTDIGTVLKCVHVEAGEVRGGRKLTKEMGELAIGVLLLSSMRKTFSSVGFGDNENKTF